MSATAVRAQVLGLAGWLALTFIAAAAGGVASAQAGQFYAQLERPGWAPPAGVFGPVWTVLYLLMGTAAWLVWRRRDRAAVAPALALYVIQLAVNALWTWIFFAWRQGAMALAEIAVLWLLVAGTVAAFWRLRPLAGALLVPYLAWVSFAAALTWSVWQLNPQWLG